VAGEIESVADEFREGMVRQGIREKYREAMAEGKGDDEFGRQDVGSDCAKPRSETFPDSSGAVERERVS